MSGHEILGSRRALMLLGCLSLQRIAGAGFPVALVVVSADLRGYAAAATIQGVFVFAATFSAPFRARLLDRIGRHRVIAPQIFLVSALLLLLGAALTTKSTPLPLVLLATIAPVITSPSTDSVIRTLWRTIGTSEQQVKALHSYDSILEEAGYLAGPFLASVLMLALGQKTAVLAILGTMITGYLLALTSRDVRSALRHRPAAAAQPAPAAAPGGPARRFLRTLAGPIASRELQRIVLPLILTGSVFGVVGILAPALCAAAGHPGDAGFVLAAISAGGVAGALIYSTARLKWPLRLRHAALGIVFGTPLVFGFLARSPWTLGILLAAGGLAVTPLYINAYLMMDAEIPDTVIHEASTWVPVGNNVGYVIGITIAASVLGRQDITAALITVTILAAVLVAYSAAQLGAAVRARPAGTSLEKATAGA